MTSTGSSVRRAVLFLLGLSTALPALGADPWIVYDGFSGPGEGKHIVLVSGDEEYRSEEALAQLGKILAKHHGFRCTALFAIDPRTGEVKPTRLDNIPGLDALASADLMVIATRFRDLPEAQMRHIDAYLRAGGPVLGMRTATHAFRVPKGKTYAHYSNGYNGPEKEWTGGFGRLVLGEKWVSHHGNHGHESTRGIIAQGAREHPIVRGIGDGDIWGPTDVYTVRIPLPGDSKPIVLGQVLKGMDPKDPPAAPEKDRRTGKTVDKNDPMMPIAWTRTYQLPGGKKGRVFTTTMGAANDLSAEGTRRMLVNAVYWCVGMADKIPAEGAEVALVGSYEPTNFGFGKHVPGRTPADYAIEK